MTPIWDFRLLYSQTNWSWCASGSSALPLLSVSLSNHPPFNLPTSSHCMKTCWTVPKSRLEATMVRLTDNHACAACLCSRKMAAQQHGQVMQSLQARDTHTQFSHSCVSLIFNLLKLNSCRCERERTSLKEQCFQYKSTQVSFGFGTRTEKNMQIFTIDILLRA